MALSDYYADARQATAIEQTDRALRVNRTFAAQKRDRWRQKAGEKLHMRVIVTCALTLLRCG